MKNTRSISGYPPRLVGFVLAVSALAVPIVAGAAARVGLGPPRPSTALGIAVFFGCAFLAELKPVPLGLDGTRAVSLAFIFVISAQALFGWQYGVLVGTLAMLGAQLVPSVPWLKLVFNTAVYAVAAFAALGAAAVAPLHIGSGDSHGAVIASVLCQGAIFVTVNVGLVCVAISLFEGTPPGPTMLDHLRHSGPAFVVMGVLAALGVILWTLDPPLLALLAAPLVTLGLYQRYALTARVAEHAATTDSLTGLRNHRAYKAAVKAGVEGAGEETPLSLCLLDIDDFKTINDRHGHPVGDQILLALASLMTSVAGEHDSFRLGGDEFVLLVHGDADRAVSVVQSLQARMREEAFPSGVRPTLGAGIATCPESATSAEELQRVADLALYWTKRHGKDRWCVYSPSVVELSWSQELAASAELQARLRAAENLIRVVDARDTYTGDHSQRVAMLVEAIAHALDLDGPTIAKVRLAGLLHDMGKIAVPDHILQKRGPLTLPERQLLRRHPEIGRDLLAGLDVHPVDEWILHHHEHWDGSGYPHGRSGLDIPIGSRIILVADAYDAMTSDRSYRLGTNRTAALAELVAASGVQFDPEVVEALIAVIARNPNVALASVADAVAV